MARVVVVGFGTRGDLYPLLGLGLGLQRRGYDVIVAEFEEYRDDVAAAGLPFAPIGPGSLCAGVYEGIDRSLEPARFRWAVERAYFDAMVAGAPATLRVLLGDVGPIDAVLSPSMHLVAGLAADRLGARWLPFVVGPSKIDGLDVSCGARRRRDLVAERLASASFARLAALAGVEGRWPSVGALLDRPTVVFGTTALSPTTDHWSPHHRLAGYPDWFGPPVDADSDDGRFLDAEHLGPLVHYSLGDGWSGALPPSLNELVRGANEEGWRVLCWTGRGSADIDDERCRVRPWGHFPSVLERADVAVNHGGMGTLVACLRAGVPSVTSPIWPDGADNARRHAELGLGVDLGLRPRPGELRDAVTEVLADDGYRRRCAQARTRTRSDADVVAMVDGLLAGCRR